ncbi:MAG: hybrid sensor histidine kinase/response regulator transcription factor [Paludibacteraceae bacterium]
MKFVLKLIFLTALLLFFTDVKSINFEHINAKNGLSNYSINSIYQDEHGFVWIGTRDGLNRYDGNKVNVFQQKTGDPSSLFGNNIRTVCGDKRGHLFLLCKSGAVFFDLKTEKFRTIRRYNVTSIASGKNNFWFAASDTIFSYNSTDKNPLKLHLLLPYKHPRITSLLETRTGLLYAAAELEGILVYDKTLKNSKKIGINHVVNLFEDSKQNIWVCTRYDGLFKIDYKGNIKNYKHDPNDPESIPDNFVRTIAEDKLGNYWVGLFVGLCKLNPEQNKFTFYKYDKQSATGLGSASVWSIINDNQGTLWIGTYFGGVDLYNPQYSFYKLYDASGGSSNSLSSPVVGRIIEATDGNLWIGTDGGGLNYFNRNKQTFTSYSWEKKLNLPIHTIKSLWLDKKRGNLWIGTHLGGLYKFNQSTQTFSSFRHNPKDPKSIPNNNVREIVHRNDTLYLATQNSIGAFDLKTESCTMMNFNDNEILKKELTDLLIDTKNRMWFAYSNNVYQYDLTKKSLKKFKINNNVLIFHEDSRKRLWAGTDGDGIYYFNETKQRFVTHTDLNKHLPSGYILAMEEAPGGNIFVTTNEGLLVVDLDFKNSQVLNVSNGFPLDAFNENSLYISENGEIFAGGVSGMVSFSENDINLPHPDYEINITGLSINNQKIEAGKSIVMPYSTPYLDGITLKPKHTVFSISFSTTNYIHSLKTDVQYMLEGFDKNWIDADYKQNITYTNLNPGKYVLRLKGKKKTSNGEYPEKTFSIVVLPPFYKTTFAYILYFLLLSLIVISIIRFYTSRIKLQASLAYEKKEKEHIEELNRSKLRFFTNISHEFRTPLTLIANQVEIMLQMANIPQNIYSRLLNIMRNSNLMKKLVTELIDFRKYEQGFLKLKFSEYDIVYFLYEIFLSFKELAQSRDISYTFECKEEKIDVWFEASQMRKVFYNLIANAFKFTPAKGKITIRIEQQDFSVLVSIIDSGIGIATVDLNKIFDRFYQAENSSADYAENQGSGIGLALAKGIVDLHQGKIGVESELNTGSRFWVELKLGDSHIDESQKHKSEDIDLEIITDKNFADKKFIDEIIQSQEEVDTHNSTILIIEDNEELLNLLVDVFHNIYHVLTAKDGVEGFEKAVKNQPDIILSDVMMPRMSGVEMTSKLKTNMETSHIPIVLLTAQTASEFVVQGLLTGADDYVTKPFNIKVLITRCNNLVNSRKLLQNKYASQPEAEPQMIATNAIDQKLLERATEIVTNHISNPDFDINTFAAEIYLSRTNLFNKIKGITGQTPNEFIINIRLKMSLLYLMNSPEMSIDDISIRVGFNSSSYFIKKFRKLYGVTPSQYRKEH